MKSDDKYIPFVTRYKKCRVVHLWGEYTFTTKHMLCVPNILREIEKYFAYFPDMDMELHMEGLCRKVRFISGHAQPA